MKTKLFAGLIVLGLFLAAASPVLAAWHNRDPVYDWCYTTGTWEYIKTGCVPNGGGCALPDEPCFNP